MPPLANETERDARERLKCARFLLHFDHTGLMRLQEVDPKAIVATGEEIAKLVGEPGVISTDQLPTLIENAARRLRRMPG